MEADDKGRKGRKKWRLEEEERREEEEKNKGRRRKTERMDER